MYKKICAFLIVCTVCVWGGCAVAAPDDSFGFMDTQYNDYNTDDNYDDYASGTDEFTDASNTDFMYAAPNDTPNE